MVTSKFGRGMPRSSLKQDIRTQISGADAGRQDAENTAQPLLLTPRQAAAALNICERTLWGLMKQGALPIVKIGRLVRYTPQDLERWIETQKFTPVLPGDSAGSGPPLLARGAVRTVANSPRTQGSDQVLFDERGSR